jgi:hypothetical protein
MRLHAPSHSETEATTKVKTSHKLLVSWEKESTAIMNEKIPRIIKKFLSKGRHLQAIDINLQ